MKIPYISDIPFDFMKNKREVLISLMVIAAVGFFVDINFLLRPQIRGLTGQLAEMGRLSSELKTASSDIASIENFKKEISLYKDKVLLYEKQLPVEQEIPSLLEYLSTIAKKSNITIIGITPGRPGVLKEGKSQEGQVYQEVPIVISAKSGYHELGIFLSNIENSDRFMKVVDIDIKVNKVTPRRHDVEVVLYTYVLLSER